MRRRRGALPVLLCIDVEPDPRAVSDDPEADWEGFERLADYLEDARPRLAHATGAPVRFNWFLRMDPQIEQAYGSAKWVADRYGGTFDRLREAGDEIGLHIHPWRWDSDTGEWVVDLADEAWGLHCVRTGFTAFEDAFGHGCRSIRFGDRWLTDANLAEAMRLGAEFDLTTEPGHMPDDLPAERTVGTMTDYWATPRHPYRPAVGDPTRGGGNDRPLWMIPITTHPLWGFGGPRVGGTESHRAPEKPGAYRGVFDVATCEILSGWAIDDEDPGRPLDIAVFDGRRCIAVLPAGTFRPDLVADGHTDDGHHAFFLPMGEGLCTGQRHHLTARILGSDFVLPGEPFSFDCSPRSADTLYPIDLAATTTSVVRSVTHLVDDRSVRHLALVIRTQVLADRAERPHFLRSFEHLTEVASTRPLRFATPDGATTILGLHQPAHA